MDLLLMMKDIEVMRINFDDGRFDVINQKYLPFQLKGKIVNFVSSPNYNNSYNKTQEMLAFRKNYMAIVMFLASRVLPLDRENAKKILTLLRLEQSQSDEYKARISLICKAVSLQDNYWVKMESDKLSWKDVSIRGNHLNRIVAQVALHGSSLTLQGKVSTPELTTHGAYAKCWKREDGDLWLYKRGHDGNTESKIEVEVSGLLDKLGVPHIKYEEGQSKGVYCCKCKCMTTDTLSMLSGMDFISYCNVNGLDYKKEMFSIDSKSLYTMFIIDYLISNRDRHGMNWGFYFNCDTMEILGCHPLYDHNNAFDRELMRDMTGGISLFDDNMCMRDMAKMALRHVSLDVSVLCESDFIVKSHYNSFMKKAKVIGLV